MTPLVPGWMKWVTVTGKGWELKHGAPESVRKQYKKFIEEAKMKPELPSQ